jgi:hypothetical protein
MVNTCMNEVPQKYKGANQHEEDFQSVLCPLSGSFQIRKFRTRQSLVKTSAVQPSGTIQNKKTKLTIHR